MLNKDYVSTEVNNIFSMLDAGELPETHSYLASIMDSDGFVSEEPFAIATNLVNCDKPQKLPDYLIEFITELYESEIENGNAEAMNDLGAQYYDGIRGFEQSFEKAIYYYDMAAENGSRQAQENLGYCYYYGRNMDAPDYEKAFQYFALGAFDGHLISLYKIGDMYLNGYYVKKNENEAFIIYMRCLETMTDEAAPIVAGPVYLRLGKMFLYGIGTEKNAKNALVCYQKAEAYLFDMVVKGDYMYKKSLDGAIAGQDKARQQLKGELPDYEWNFD